MTKHDISLTGSVPRLYYIPTLNFYIRIPRSNQYFLRQSELAKIDEVIFNKILETITSLAQEQSQSFQRQYPFQ